MDAIRRAVSVLADVDAWGEIALSCLHTFLLDGVNPGYSELPRVQFIEGDISSRPEISLEEMELITNATVMTVTHGTIDKGSVWMHDGKIAGVGTAVAAFVGLAARGR